MEHRIFGKEITNIPGPEVHKSRRGYSTMHEDRVSMHSKATQGTAKPNSTLASTQPQP